MIKNRMVFTGILISVLLINSYAQKNERTFIFGHSLIHHEFQVNPTPSQETSVPHWMHFLAAESGHEFAVGGQYGFLPQHANLPPISQWGFDFVAGAWESDTEPFSDADFTNILITPGNFIQWQSPDSEYPGDDITPIGATHLIFDWCIEQENSLNFFVYENWPDMAPYLANGFPPNESEWNAYLQYLNGDFHDWFVEYFEAVSLNYPNTCVRMIPVGTVINNLLKQDPFNQIPITELYEDDAPHGRASIYFLASIATYMAMYEERPSPDYTVDDIIHPIIRDNYDSAVDYIWQALLIAEDVSGKSTVFCSDNVSTANHNISRETAISIFPNPTGEELNLKNLEIGYNIELFNSGGHLVYSKSIDAATQNRINIAHIENGIYYLVVRDLESNVIFSDSILIIK